LGNPDLKPEKATSNEIGLRFANPKVTASLAVYNRKAKNLIDFVKNSDDESTLFRAENIQQVNTRGIDLEIMYRIPVRTLTHEFKLSYSYLENSLEDSGYKFSRYSINNDLKHNFIAGYYFPLYENFSTYVVFKNVIRTSGDAYAVIDASGRWTLDQLEVSVYFNNIFNTEYWESNLVPMPKGNGLLGLRYSF